MMDVMVFLFGRSSLLAELLSTPAVPGCYIHIGFQGKRILWKILGETLSRIRVLDIEIIDRILYKRHMFLRS